MVYPDIFHHDTKDGVTGSCRQLLMDDEDSLLIDCGLFQGAETKSSAKRQAMEFPLDTIEVLVATYVHIEHVGRTLYLLVAGFKWLILCSESSTKLLPIVSENAFKLGTSCDQKRGELLERRIIVLLDKTCLNLPSGRGGGRKESGVKQAATARPTSTGANCPLSSTRPGQPFHPDLPRF